MILQKELSVAVLAAKMAGRMQKRLFKKPKRTRRKELLDIVTNVDLMSQKLIVSMITKRFPEHVCMSEELPSKKHDAKYVWVIDPLDGSVNYASGIPFFSVSIALVSRDKALLGVVFNPMTGELFHATLGEGAYVNEKPVHVSRRRSLGNCLVSVMMTSHFSTMDINRTLSAIGRIAPRVRGIRIFTSEALELCYVACGRLDASLCMKSDPFSTAAASLIAMESGGRVTGATGLDFTTCSDSILASNSIMHNSLIDLVEGESAKRP